MVIVAGNVEGQAGLIADLTKRPGITMQSAAATVKHITQLHTPDASACQGCAAG